MSTRRESNQAVPSVLAKLMGLAEVTPQQQPVSKKPRVLSENYLHRVASVGVTEKCSNHHSFRSRINDQDECKNVFQVLETLRRNKRHVSGNAKINERNDASSQLVHVAAKSSCTPDGRDITMCRKFRRKSEQGYVNSPKKVQNDHGMYSSRELFIDDMKESSKSNLNLNDRSSLSTRIVALQPNLGKADITARCFSSSTQSHDASDSGNGKENLISTSWNGNVHLKMKGRKKIRNGAQPDRPRFRFLRERTKNMGHGTSSMFHMEPLSENSGNGSFEKKVRSAGPSSPIVYDRSSQVYCSDRAYVAREAKKQISERWKTAKSFWHVELANRSKTLGEVLVVPDKSGKFSPSTQSGSDVGEINFGTPLGIGGWVCRKGKCSKNLPRSKSFHAVGGLNTRTNHEPLENGGYRRNLMSINLINSHLREDDLSQKNGAQDGSKDSSYRNSQAIPHVDSENNFPVRDNFVIQDEQGENFKKTNYTWNENEGRKEDFSEHIPAVPKCSMDSSFVISMGVDVDSEVVHMSPFTCKEHQSESRNWIFLSENKESSYIQDALLQQEFFNEIFEEESISSQYSGTDPESLMSAEEAYQPSPNSVLERMYKKEIVPISNCFKSVNTSLHGLHAQLELLKSDALETYSEVSSMMVSGEEDTEDESVKDYEEKVEIMRSFRVEESRDFSYLVDVLSEAGFHNVNLHANFDAWHKQEFPISYSVFDTLEKKYGEQISWKKAERKLLFDRINYGLVQVLQQLMGVLTQRKPVARRLTFSQGHEMIEEELWMLLVNQEKEASKESEKFFGKDDWWLELDDDIQIIGREIENSLIDELVVDIRMESF